MKVRRGLPDLADFIFPRLAGSRRSREVNEKRQWRKLARNDERAVASLGSDAEQLGHYSAEVGKLLDYEQSRRQSVESRLTSIVGMTSIAATIVLGASLSLAAGTLPALPRVAAAVFTGGCLYLVLQLFCALNAAVRGLSRASQLELTAADLFEAENTAPPVRLRRDITRKLELLRDQRRGIDVRVSHMAVAQQAIRNLVFGLLLLAFAAAWFAIARDGDSTSRKDGLTPVELQRGQAQPPYERPPAASAPRPHFSAPVADGLRLPLLMAAGGLALFVIGVAVLVKGWQSGDVAAGAALVTGGVALSLLGGSKFEFEIGKFDNLIGELQLEFFKPAARPPQARPVLIRVATIGPFPDGDHVMHREQVLHCVRRQMTRDFTATVGGWQIIGRVDRRQLKPERALLYGSNQALAMNRATWVRDYILAGIPETAIAQSIVSVGGAQGVSNTVSEAEMGRDRAVDIYALVAQPADETGGPVQTRPMPVLCPDGRFER